MQGFDMRDIFGASIRREIAAVDWFNCGEFVREDKPDIVERYIK